MPAVDQSFFEANVSSKYTDVVNEKLGASIISFSDEWFADAANLIKPSAPIRQPGKFTPAGAWYDGWETRRHNTAEFDWVIIKLGVSSARLIGAEVDTAFFNGNHAPHVAVYATSVSSEADLESAQWDVIVSKKECGPSQRHFFARKELTKEAYTHVRLQMYPDGGIARLRVYGTPVAVFPANKDAVIDLAYVSNGAVAVARSDQHFGSADNLLIPGRGKDMGDGWETARSRTPGHVDWVIVRLGAAGIIKKVVVDTAHFIGNYPQAVQVDALEGSPDETPAWDSKEWKTIVPKSKAFPTKEHEFEVTDSNKYTYAKLTIFPDGGVKRFRVFGTRA